MILPLRLEQASYAAGGRDIVAPLSLEIDAGPNTVILGANGAGKSVLMRLMHGLLVPTAGRIAWSGGDQRRARRPQEGLPIMPCQYPFECLPFLSRTRLLQSRSAVWSLSLIHI